MINKFKNMSLMNVIFLTITLVFILLALFSGSFSVPALLAGFAFIGLAYILFTRRFYVIIPILSIYYMLVILSTLPLTAYYVLGEDPSFIVASAPLGFFLTLWISNTIKFSELSIRSPWIANALGLSILYIVELTLVYAGDGMSQVLIGVIGFFSFMLVSMIYLVFSPTSWVNTPNPPNQSDVEEFTNSLINEGDFSYAEDNKGNIKKDIVVRKSEGINYLYKLSPIGNQIVYNKENKKYKKWMFRIDLEDKRAYSWLYKKAVESYESKGNGKGNYQFPIVIEDVDNKKEFPDIEVIELPRPRSKKVYYIGKITLSANEERNIRMFNKLTIMLEMKSKED